MPDQFGDKTIIDLTQTDPVSSNNIIQQIGQTFPPNLRIETAESIAERTHRLEQEKGDADWERYKGKVRFWASLIAISLAIAISVLILLVDTFTDHKIEAELKKTLYTILTGVIAGLTGYSIKK